MKLFTAEDFNELFRIAPSRRQEVAAEIANAKIEREGKRVTRQDLPIMDCWKWGENNTENHKETHEALLINIQPLKSQDILKGPVQSRHIVQVNEIFEGDWRDRSFESIAIEINKVLEQDTKSVIPDKCDHPKEKIKWWAYKTPSGVKTDWYEGFYCECGVKVVGFDEQK